MWIDGYDHVMKLNLGSFGLCCFWVFYGLIDVYECVDVEIY